MKTHPGLLSIVALVSVLVLGPAIAGAQFGTPPTQSSSTKTTTTTTTTTGQVVFGQPAWLQQVTLKVPSFAGSGLLNNAAPFLADVRVDHANLTYREGDTLSIDFKAEQNAYLYLIYHQADGKILLLFPNQAHITNLVPALQNTTVPQTGDFRFRITPPFGTEVLQVLATLQPVDELDQLVKNTGSAAPVPAEAFTALEQRLKKDTGSWTEHRVPVQTISKSAVEPGHKPSRVGLFVGVNRFQVETDDEKKKDVNLRFRLGAELMAKTLRERGGLDPDRTKTLVAEEATRANIEAAFTRWLPSATKPGDTVFVFYAGHGGLVKNLDGTKPDGKDGVLSTYNNSFLGQKLTDDARDVATRENFISDTTLARWLQELPGRQIVLLISSCHAASMIDSRLLTKFASREATRVKGISDVNSVVMVSCFPEESTLSEWHKPVWMAQYLAEAMAKLPAPVTLERAFEYYRQEHRRRLTQEKKTGFHEPLLTDTALLPVSLVP